MRSPENIQFYAYTIVGNRPEKRTAIYMHRLVMGAALGEQVDHIDGNGLNDCKNNLRLVTQPQNNMNQKACRRGSSKFKGIRLHSKANRWTAQIGVNGKQIYLGMFKDEVSAAIVYNKAAIHYFGEYAKLNEVNTNG